MSWLGDRWASGLRDLAPDQESFDRANSLAVNARVSITGIEPGQISGIVFDRVQRSVTIGLATIPDTANPAVAKLLAGSPALLAEVMIGRMPAEIDSFLLDAGVNLVPSISDILAECDCDSYEPVCRHCLAVMAELGSVSRSDPFVLTLVRGLDRSQIMEEAFDLRGYGDARGESTLPRGPDPGTSAATAFRKDPAPAPRSLLIPSRPAVVTKLEPGPPLDSGLSSDDLAGLISDAAGRAVDLLTGTQPSTLRYDIESDLARRASTQLAAGEGLGDLAAAAGLAEDELAERARCWNVGGRAALAVRTDSWPAEASEMEPGRLSFDPPGRVSANSVASGRVQLRLDRAGNWWRFEADQERGWVLASGGFDQPRQALDDDWG